MKPQLSVILTLVAFLACFVGYCFALIDWVQDTKTGVYDKHHSEAFYETAALTIYTVFGLRFLAKRINLF